METTPFQDYSNVLVPLPPLGPEVPPPQADSSSSTDTTFAEVLESQLTEQVSQSTEPREIDPDFFNLAAPPASLTHSSLPLSESADFIPLNRNALLLANAGPDLVNEDDQELMRICREIEGFLLGILLKNLGKDFGGSGLFNQTAESSFYQDMFFFQLAETIGTTPPGIGIADSLYDDIMLKAIAGSVNQLV